MAALAVCGGIAMLALVPDGQRLASAGAATATANETPVRNISSSGLPRSQPVVPTTIEMPMERIPNCFPRTPSLRCSGVVSSPTVCVSWAMRPNSVPIPVATTTPYARPFVADVPIQVMDDRSASGAVDSVG